MAGLINSAAGMVPPMPTANPMAQPAPGPSAPGMPTPGNALAGQSVPGAEQMNAPTLRMAMQKISIAAKNALYANGAMDHAVAMIRSAPSAAQALANVAFHLLASIFAKAGGQLPPAAFGGVTMQVLMMIAKSCQAAGVKIDGQDVALAKSLMLVMLMKARGLDTSKIKQTIMNTNFASAGQIVDAQLQKGA